MAKSKITNTGNLTSNSMFFNICLFAVLLIAVIILFHSFVFSDKGLWGSDTIQAGMFFRGFYADYYQQTGSVPVWNPYQFCGIPYIECFHGDTFYFPFTALKFYMSVFRAWGWNLFIHVFIAGITMFFCARVFRRSQMASALAAVSYMFAACFISQVAPGHDGKMFVTALFPLTIMLIELGFSKKPLICFSCLGLTIGLIILTPHPQMAYYSLWACAFYTAYKLVFLYIDTKSIPRLIKPTSLFVGAVVIGLAISAIHFYPGYQYVKKYSPRSDEKRGEEWARSFSMHPEETFSLIVPEFCGVSGEAGNSYWGRNGFKDNSEYTGVIPLMLAIVAVALIRNRKTWFFGGLAIFALIHALAGNTWFFYLFYHLIPNMKSTRSWSMIMFLFSFSAALLAAFALDFIIEQGQKLKVKDRRLFVLTLFSIPTLTFLGGLMFSGAPESAINIYKSIFYNVIPSQNAIALRSHLGTIAAGFWTTFLFTTIAAVFIWLYAQKKIKVVLLWVVVLVAFIDVYRFDRQFIKTYDPATIFAKNPIVDFFKSKPDKFRVLDTTGQRFLPTNYLPYYGVEEMTSYHGSQPNWFHKLLGGTAMRNIFNFNLMNMTNTRYLLISPASAVKGNQLERVGFIPAYQWQNFEIFENPFANNRAHLVHNWVVEPDTARIDSLVLMRSFNPKSQVALFEDPGISPTLDTTSFSADRVEITEYKNDYISVTVSSSVDGILVLADNWYPAWKAFVDGNEVEVMMANAAFRGVVLSAGEHTVEFMYISEAYATGKMLTLFGLITALAGIAVGGVITRNKNIIAEGQQDG
ncbi:MAG: YfhO family protein [candidate division Zixibacteria bacterium]